MRVRKTFAAAFAALFCIAAFLGLAPQTIPAYKQSDKVLHTVTFFLLTLSFYWILETSRRRAVHITLLACTAGLSIGSEVAQGLLPNGRNFDPYDIAANVIGSGGALAICSWYHKRMLERRRAAKTYNLVPGEEGEVDVELGETIHREEQETGVVEAAEQTVTEQLDNWDENAEDWEDPDDDMTGKAASLSGNLKKATMD
ncbi:hypothetical protein CAC42_4424 [Sphaceloma murrayae]|uniref:VanZ-like domain-containing protein n=1 Tax=Sphaceloma murrayae TaxID=2082308 RepID=A0A2K1QMG5_9PEZI|nr:hypothetical protein CAC42_4424 [Sphaceloma murrayae]